MAHHGSPDGAGHPGAPAADQPTQAQPAQPGSAEPTSAYPQQPAYPSDQGYNVPQQPIATHDHQSTGFGQPAQSTQGGYNYNAAPQAGYGQPPAPDQGYAAQGGYGQPAAPDQAYAAQGGYGQPEQATQGGYGQPEQGYAPTGYAAPQQSAFAAPTQQTGYVAPAPGYGNQPMSAPPVSASPLTGTPMSAPPMSPPMSAPPGFGAPGYGYGAQPAPGQPGYGQTGYQPAIDPATGMPIAAPAATRKRGVAVPLLAGFLVLALIAAGVFVGMYLDKSNKLTKSDKVVAQQKQAIADRDADLKKARSDLQDKSDALATAQQDLRGTQADNTETKREKDVIAKCLSMIDDALAATSQSDFNTKWKALADPCKQADAVLGL